MSGKSRGDGERRATLHLTKRELEVLRWPLSAPQEEVDAVDEKLEAAQKYCESGDGAA